MGLTIALNRGRILEESLPMLAAAGIVPEEDPAASRKLIFATRQGGHRLVVMRGADVPTYVEYGAADVGIVGKDTLLEHGGSADYYERLDLGIAKCRIMVAAPAGADLGSGKPLMNLADCIVDIVDTGNTLRANGLEALETIAHVSSRMIVNRAAMKTRFDAVQSLTCSLRDVSG